MDRPIPAFYCCYLLRSTVRHSSLYIGSTPNPVRRLKQHNGDTKGGAVRTSRQNLRPWEMSCLVIGFPSKIAALQFEWAWQNTHLTRHILPEERITKIQSKTRFSPRTGKPRKRPARPRMSLTDRLLNLQMLLNASSFQRWPLQIRFFASDVYRIWQRVTVNSDERELDPARVVLDQSAISPEAPAPDETVEGLVVAPALRGIHVLDATYEHMKPTLQNSLSILERARLKCVLCRKDATKDADHLLVCSNEKCKSSFHMLCLSQSFLEKDGSASAILPTTSMCPKCSSELSWSDLVRDLSLRIRGAKERATLFKEKRRKKSIAVVELAEALADAKEATESEEDEELDATGFRLPRARLDTEHVSDDEWKSIDAQETPSQPDISHSREAANARVNTASRRQSQVIDDSDWDSAEVLD